MQPQPDCLAARGPIRCRPSVVPYGVSSRWQCGALIPRRLSRSSVGTTAAVAAGATAASQAAQTTLATLLMSVGIFVLTCAVAAFLICAIPTLLVPTASLVLRTVRSHTCPLYCTPWLATTLVTPSRLLQTDVFTYTA